MRQLYFQVSIRSELIVGRFRAMLDQLAGIIPFGVIPGKRLLGRIAFCILRGARESTKEKVQRGRCEHDRGASHVHLSEGWEGYSIHTSKLARVSRRGWRR